MKIQITRLSPHQNAKVFGILIALTSLLFVLPIAILFSFIPAGFDAQGNPIPKPSAFLTLLFPLFYLVTGYIMTVAGCLIYNFMFKYIGGFDYETRDQ